MELDPKYVDVIVKRWEEHSGMDAQIIKITKKLVPIEVLAFNLMLNQKSS